MGTRHIIEVVKDNRLVIRQYGQWDGYAETAGYHLRNFIKNHGINKIKEIVDKTEIQNAKQAHKCEPDLLITPSGFKIAEAMLYTDEIGNYIQKIKELGLCIWAYDMDTHLATILPCVEKFGLEKTMQHYMLTRDTGYKILDVMGIFSCFPEIENNELKIPVYLEDDDINPGRKIIINTDDKTFTCEYFNKKQTWSCDKLPTLAELRKLDK